MTNVLLQRDRVDGKVRSGFSDGLTIGKFLSFGSMVTCTSDAKMLLETINKVWMNKVLR
jgi:hypothetical protein